jgi:hypothetical protein
VAEGEIPFGFALLEILVGRKPKYSCIVFAKNRRLSGSLSLKSAHFEAVSFEKWETRRFRKIVRAAFVAQRVYEFSWGAKA